MLLFYYKTIKEIYCAFYFFNSAKNRLILDNKVCYQVTIEFEETFIRQ